MGMRLYMDLGSGIAGDMFLAACLDLGLDFGELQQALSSLPLPAWQLVMEKNVRGGMAGVLLQVRHEQVHEERNYYEIEKIIADSLLPPVVKENACQIFALLAEAEAKVHGVTRQEIHFHEVGAIDAIIDICGAAYAMWRLGVVEVVASKAVTGSGWVECAHGRLPVPPPAVVEMLRAYRVPLQPDEVQGELITPTGAAILVHIVQRFGAMSLARIDACGHGLGHRQWSGRANVLRLLAEIESPAASKEVVLQEWVAVLTTSIDDMNPQWYGVLWEYLFAAGALDLSFAPVMMKKGRPGVCIEVIAPIDKEDLLCQVLLKHTTSLGVRKMRVERQVLARQSHTLATPWGVVRVKEAGGLWREEFEDMKRVAEMNGWSLMHAHQQLAGWLQKNGVQQIGE